jgi:DnaJ-class molecular chaperone
MSGFEEIDRARKLLGLNETATAKQIKQAYRRLAFRHHPDRSAKSGEGEEIMKQVNRAYRLLQDYVDNYSYPFTKEDVTKAYPYEQYLRRYRDGWFDGI